MPSVFITGANRGIGLELARQYAAEGWTVHATCRDPDKAQELQSISGARIHQLDVTDRGRIKEVARIVDDPLDVVIANAGIMGPKGDLQTFGQLDYDGWADTLAVNTLGAVATCEAFTPHLERGERKKMTAITSKMGSIDDTSGGRTAYRSSKTALNMAMTAAAAGLADRGIAVGVLHPGWVQTDMGGPSALISTEESARGLRQVIDGLEPAPKAHFRAFDGKEIPW
jgi:NAD(P)-dependent dehydrogenase (short-subunit alcohol dehydrogenase family)